MEIDIRKEKDEIERIRFASGNPETPEENTISGDKHDPYIRINDECCNETLIAKGDLDNFIKALERAKQIW